MVIYKKIDMTRTNKTPMATAQATTPAIVYTVLTI